ncbi:MAG: prolipoprotein diacylglyceryl transferase [Planctomycetota bacterium]|nr:MAG: prolipoprotein diacylglyceryl transferase [Planctomycetota bacterium]
MHPKLFEIPFIHLTVPSYGLMMVVGFLMAVWVIRRLSRDITPDPQFITNAALYSLIAGVVGARLFFVVHYFYKFKGDLLSVFAIWRGGVELLGGVLLAIAVIFFYLWYHKLPIRRYLDILAIGLMLALVFGRIGCFLNGDCFGKPTSFPWAVRFPYHHPILTHSPAYHSQAHPNLDRNRHHPQLKLPADFFGYLGADGQWYPDLKPYDQLTSEQKQMVDKGAYRCLPVHPTQLYLSAAGAILALILYLFWRRGQKARYSANPRKFLTKPGCTFGLMFILYGTTRFFIEFVRDDNPFEIDALTISQIISVLLIILGVALMIVFEKTKPEKTAATAKKPTQER